MPTFIDPQGQKLWVWDSIATLSLDIPTPGGLDLDKTQVTELVSFLQKWLEEQDNGTGTQDL